MTNGIQITPRNDRGFSQYGKPVATDYGHKVEVFESSSAEAAKCWLRIYDDGQVAIDHHKGLSVSAHLTVDQAIAVRDRLSTFINQAVGVSDTNQEKQ